MLLEVFGKNYALVFFPATHEFISKTKNLKSNLKYVDNNIFMFNRSLLDWGVH